MATPSDDDDNIDDDGSGNEEEEEETNEESENGDVEMEEDFENDDVELEDDSEKNDDDEEVRVVAVVTSARKNGNSNGQAPVSPKELYRKRRRKIRRMLRPGAVPSFLSLIVDDGNTDDEDDDNWTSENQVFHIDVDEYLGLKKSKHPNETTNSELIPDVPGSSIVAFPPQQISLVSPADEGWYEGVVSPIAMAEDADHLSEMHLLVRRNLEFFSATAMDTAISQAGRRTPTVLGKVGLRCIHCNRAAKIFLERKQREADGDHDYSDDQPAISAHQLWPPGSISYPVNVAGLYAVCAQKPQLHFEKCPNLPPDIKSDFLRLFRDDPTGTPKKRQRQSVSGTGTGISAIMYYSVAAKRIGLVDVPGGIRFGRDLTLEPLSIEAVRNQVEDKTKLSKRLSGSHISSPAANSITSPSRASGPDEVPNGIPVERIAADPESESVLAEAIAQEDDPMKFLARSEDKSLVTDFIFLIIRQMAICRAMPSDFASRGKKTKLMRVGFAGFCCRHCMMDANTTGPPSLVLGDYCCRSFSSAADNLASAISNSFVLHLQKCYRVPSALKKALTAYKRLHSRQMAQLQYGSQRRLFHALWTRLRAADLSEVEMMEQLKALGASLPPSSTTSVGGDDSDSASPSTPQRPTDVEIDQPTSREEDQNKAEDSSARTLPGDHSTRPASFPVCDDPETQVTLKRAGEVWDPRENDNLILPSEHHLVSDYVFLTMRQLKMIHPTAVDKSRIRRVPQGGPLPGMCCKYCLNAPSGHVMTPSGRSFPSAPDNMASALNTSLFNHMQNCYLVPDELKRALFHLKKIHSAQCSSLKFGSQRRYFNLVFDRLRKVNASGGVTVPETHAVTSPTTNNDSAVPTTTARELDKEALAEYHFAEGPFGSLVCQRCRMVPFEFRAPGSTLLQRPATSDALCDHADACQKDSLDLTFCAKTLQEFLQESNLTIENLSHPLFKQMVIHAMGGDSDLVPIFTDAVCHILETGSASNDDGMWNTAGLWLNFPSVIDVEAVASAVDDFVKAMELKDDAYILRYLHLISPALYYSMNIHDND
jgi:hypothetical protein